MDPSGKSVIITGASSGIGAAAARAFAAAGARVVLAARDEARLRAVAAGLAGRPLVVPTDVSDRAAVERLVEAAASAFGGVDIVINNAGVGLAAPVADLRAEDLQRALAVDLLGPLALTQAALPHMRRQGRGQLIYISSVVGLRALPYLGGYAAAKAALDRLTESLRVELRGSGVAVTLVRPGTTRTGFAEHRIGSGRERRRVSARAATPEQVARALVRAARREPRVAYVSPTDRLTVLISLLAPRLADWLLGRSFRWEE
ncbi:MAG: SDR family NAD(P)-dependent oxidoreductase [Kouleothrix sp.]|nr:SDR family NAD(P)-dependent oxidoreductase [Kouleothrix sp.]